MVNSYTIGSALEKENMKDFLSSEIIPEMINEQCEAECNQTTGVVRGCVEACIESQNITEKVDEKIDEIYEQPLYGSTIGDVTSFLSSSFILLLILSIVSGIILFLISDYPLKKIGWSVLWVGISILMMGIIPMIIPLPTIPTLQSLINYILNSFAQMINIGIIFVVASIVLLVANKKLNIKRII